MTSAIQEELLRRAVRSQERAPAVEDLRDRLPSPWASSLQATCDCLSSHGVLDNVERRHREDELGQTVPADLAAEVTQLVIATQMLVERGLITDEELTSRMDLVRERFARID